MVDAVTKLKRAGVIIEVSAPLTHHLGDFWSTEHKMGHFWTSSPVSLLCNFLLVLLQHTVKVLWSILCPVLCKVSPRKEICLSFGLFAWLSPRTACINWQGRGRESALPGGGDIAELAALWRTQGKNTFRTRHSGWGAHGSLLHKGREEELVWWKRNGSLIHVPCLAESQTGCKKLRATGRQERLGQG